MRIHHKYSRIDFMRMIVERKLLISKIHKCIIHYQKEETQMNVMVQFNGPFEGANYVQQLASVWRLSMESANSEGASGEVDHS